MSGSESGSESEPEFESIIATRARRSNAGSRLRQLLDLEETNSGPVVSNEDDENVNLLFQEDEDDQEFEESESEEEQEQNEESEEEDQKSEKAISAVTTQSDNDDNSDDNDGAIVVNSDEMLSDSDISASDNDEYEGERELQKQEKLNKRRKRKAELPSILQKKKPKTSKQSSASLSPKSTPDKTVVNKSHRSNIFDNEPIAPTLRRHSSRKTTLQNSIAVHERMEKEYERRQTQVPVAKKEYVEKTLEEKLEEAKITEKENTLSLTRFYEQEIQKKKKQRDMANSRKFKLTNFVRFLSSGIYITPMDEIEMIEEEKRKVKLEEEHRSRRKLQYLKRKQTRLEAKLAKKGILIPKVTEDQQTETTSNDNKTDEQKVNESDDVKTLQGILEEIKQITDLLDHSKPKMEETDTKAEEGEEKNVDMEKEGETEEVIKKEETEKLNDGMEVKEESTEPVKTVRFNDVVTISNGETTESRPVSIEPDSVTEETVEIDELSTSNLDTSKLDEESEQDKTPKVIYEGPPQRVTRNYLIFEEFDKAPSMDDIKKHLFGQQSVLKGSRHDPQCETLCVIKQSESSNIDLQKIQAARNESFKSLIQLPKFGEKITVLDDDNGKLSMEENEVVQIHTPAPVGINLPNGQKKACLISGLPAMYYDPTNGVPYATVDAFSILKGIADGEYKWLQLDNGGINSRFKGGIGCYIGKRNQKHASGVPEGFK